MSNSLIKSFASDNHAGIHPEILRAIIAANHGPALAYGADSYTAAALAKFQEHFGPEIAVYFVFNGTAANVLGLNAVVQPYQAVIATANAHINTDECGAPERFIGCKLVAVPTDDGKLSIDQIATCLDVWDNEHHNQPKAVSITQSTELGAVYTPAEIKALAVFAHERGMLLHMDGARLANAAAGLNVGLNDISGAAGVDILSFGGAKNGLMLGEAVVFFRPDLAPDFKYLRKQGMQLASKMRFIAAQFETLLSNDLWLRNARHANVMARLLAAELAGIPQLKITQPVEANAVFVIIPPQFIPLIQAEYYFYVWDETTSEVRLMTAFDTTEQDVLDLVRVIKKIVQVALD